MKRLFQTVTLLGTLFLGQQVLAQDREQKDPFYVQRFSRDNPLYFPYQDNRVQLLRLNFNYPHSPETRIAQDPGNVRELENFLSRHTPLLGTFLEADNEPFQFKSLNFTFGSSARKNSLDSIQQAKIKLEKDIQSAITRLKEESKAISKDIAEKILERKVA